MTWRITKRMSWLCELSFVMLSIGRLIRPTPSPLKHVQSRKPRGFQLIQRSYTSSNNDMRIGTNTNIGGDTYDPLTKFESEQERTVKYFSSAAVSEFLLGNYEGTVEQYKKAIAADPKAVDPLMNISGVYYLRLMHVMTGSGSRKAAEI